MREKLKLTGTVHLEIIQGGKVVRKFDTRNLVTARGKEILAERLFYAEDSSHTSPDITTIKIGNSDVAAALDQTELVGDEQLSKAIHYKAIEDNSIKYFTTFIDKIADTLTDPITEIGLFTDGNEMICRTVLTEPFTKAQTDLLSIYWRIEIG